MALKLAKNAKNALSLAKLEAKRYNLVYIGTELVLLALVEERGSIAQRVFAGYDIDGTRLRREVESNVLMGEQPLRPGQVIRAAPLVRRVVEIAKDESDRLGSSIIGCEHLLLALVRERNGVAAEVLDNLNIDRNEMRDRIMDLIKNGAQTGHAQTSWGDRQADIEEESSPHVALEEGDTTDLIGVEGGMPAPATSSPGRLRADNTSDAILVAAALAMKSVCEKYIMLKAQGRSDNDLIEFLKVTLRNSR